MQQIHCPTCSRLVPAVDIDLPSATAKCSSCDSVFSISIEGARPARKAVPKPDSIETASFGGELELRYSWKAERQPFLWFFAIFWNAIVFTFIGSMLRGGFSIGLLFISIHLTIGLGLIYWIAMVELNATTIVASGARLAVRTGPIPNIWSPDFEVSASEVSQIIVEQYATGKNGSTVQYKTLALLKNGQPARKILGGLSDQQAALFIEQELERKLKIKDDPDQNVWLVPGRMF